MYYEINENSARLSKQLNSFYNYKIGSATQEYRQTVNEIIQYVEKCNHVITDEKRLSRIDCLVEKFSKKYVYWVNKHHRIECYCPSVMITGGSNFPIRRKEKQNAMRSRHYQEYEKIMDIKSKIESIANGNNIIKSDGPNAVKEIEDKILRLENRQKEMKEANAYYRKHKSMKRYKKLSDEDAENFNKEIKSG